MQGTLEAAAAGVTGVAPDLGELGRATSRRCGRRARRPSRLGGARRSRGAAATPSDSQRCTLPCTRPALLKEQWHTASLHAPRTDPPIPAPARGRAKPQAAGSSRPHPGTCVPGSPAIPTRGPASPARSPLSTHLSSLSTHPSSLITQHSSLSTQHSVLITQYSPPTPGIRRPPGAAAATVGGGGFNPGPGTRRPRFRSRRRRRSRPARRWWCPSCRAQSGWYPHRWPT